MRKAPKATQITSNILDVTGTGAFDTDSGVHPRPRDSDIHSDSHPSVPTDSGSVPAPTDTNRRAQSTLPWAHAAPRALSPVPSLPFNTALPPMPSTRRTEETLHARGRTRVEK